MQSAHGREPSAEYAEPATIVQPLVDQVDGTALVGARPIVVAIDGRSGCGKSTLADAFVSSVLAVHSLDAVVVGGDEFYGGRSAASWDALSTAENADLAFDWQRQHAVLTSLRDNAPASWLPFDWADRNWDSDSPPRSSEPSTCRVADLVVLEGVYCARPELWNVLDVRALLNTPADQRHRQLVDREGEGHDDPWARRWSTAEDHYFGNVMKASDYDIVL